MATTTSIQFADASQRPEKESSQAAWEVVMRKSAFCFPVAVQLRCDFVSSRRPGIFLYDAFAWQRLDVVEGIASVRRAHSSLQKFRFWLPRLRRRLTTLPFVRIFTTNDSSNTNDIISSRKVSEGGNNSNGDSKERMCHSSGTRVVVGGGVAGTRKFCQKPPWRRR